MKKSGFLLLLIFLTFQSYSQTKNFIDKPYLETTATVDTLVVPDRIYLSISITEKDTKGRTSVEELENRMNVKLKSLGIDTKKQLFLSDVASNFKKYFLRRTDVLKNKAYTLLVYDAETAGKAIVGLEDIKISNVYLSKTEYSKIEQLKVYLKQKAISKAKMQAKAMLEPLNQKLGNAIYISDSNTRTVPNFNVWGGSYAYSSSSYKTSDYKPINIQFKKIKIESTVKVNFGIE